MMKVETQKEHRWLQQLVGTWQCEHMATIEPGKKPELVTWTETVRSLDGVWIVGESSGDMPGCGNVTTIITLGFDAAKKRFVGTWVGSMMPHLWIYDGELDSSEKVLTLHSSGPAFDNPGHTTKFKDVIELRSNDERTLTGIMLDKDGKWSELMTMTQRRLK
ncbi:MAG: DUF1579 domain-containing protein [candidate division Zixibacteria bacterium]|jgi:hypothetical protein|nr:DUF1579 domain-containing protein [candidate division Zixibacteria bacterium]